MASAGIYWNFLVGGLIENFKETFYKKLIIAKTVEKKVMATDCDRF